MQALGIAGSSPPTGKARLARELMEGFAERTGLDPPDTPRRYLWTDAYAVGNFLALHRHDGDARWRLLALRLADQVHLTLGRHRADADPRHGSLSGLDDREAGLHPTRGGLRIGKLLPERGPGEAYDPRAEWDRDGQYFHYLTRWAQALARLAAETGELRFHRWARELAATAHSAFTYRLAPGEPPRMVWKMSVDLSHPLVLAMGQHDPLDALVTWLDLETSTADGDGGPSLEREIGEAIEMCAGQEWMTEDPLGIGGLLDAAARLADIVLRRGVAHGRLLRQTLLDALASLEVFSRSAALELGAGERLAFRELGLAIGLRALERREPLLLAHANLVPAVEALLDVLPLADRIESFWSDPAHRGAATWLDHRDINDVMLATALLPEGCLG